MEKRKLATLLLAASLSLAFPTVFARADVIAPGILVLTRIPWLTIIIVVVAVVVVTAVLIRVFRKRKK